MKTFPKFQILERIYNTNTIDLPVRDFIIPKNKLFQRVKNIKDRLFQFLTSQKYSVCM